MATTSVTFPNIINVVLNDTLSRFISTTTVSPTVPGTFAFFTNNSSGAVLTSSSVFDTVGNFTIFCTFTPADTVTYQASSGTVIVTVHDSDAYNNYYNVPVTDLSNVLVNGDFNYIPSSIAPGTMSTITTNVPGWTFYKYSAYNVQLVNNMDVSLGITYPPPFASTTTKIIYFTGGYLFQWFYCLAGTYQFSAYYAAPSVSSNYIYFGVDSLSSTHYRSSTQYPNLQNWQLYTQTITISTTGMHRIFITTNSNSQFYAANISLKPISNPFYLLYSKINSQIFNGTFETDVQTANSRTMVPLTNWIIDTNNVWVLNNYSTYTTVPFPYPSGSQCIEIQGLGKITQTFNYIDSSSNYLSFYICGVNDAATNGIRVSMNSTQIFDTSSVILSTTGLNSGSWQKMIFSGITTVAGPNTLTIEGLTAGTATTAIDNVIFGSVTKETPMITYSSTQTNTYGTPLIANLNATCSVPATFQYYLDATYTDQIFADSTLPVGIYTVYVVATPLYINNYTIAYASASLTVVSPNAQIVFPNIINVVLNDTLSAFLTGTTVSPSIAGTFTFQKTNSSGAVLTSSSVFDAVGNYTIFCTFTPTDSVAVSASYTVFVQDKDVFNNYYNIPVTDTTNMIVNGNFDYVPSNIAPGTSSTGLPTNIPGWSIVLLSSNGSPSQIFNDVSLGSGITSQPYPFGTKCLRVRNAVFQMFYAVAGTYTFSAYMASTATSTQYVNIDINTTRILSPTFVQGWRIVTANFTVTTGMHRLQLNYSGAQIVYTGGISIKPVTNPVYLRFSKINSLISNGIFETEIKTANSKSLTPITNWSVATNNVWVLNNFSRDASSIPMPYPSGNQCIAIEALGKITQTFTATASTSNFLSFYACSIRDTSTNTIQISVNSTVVANTNLITSRTWSKFIYSGITTVDGTNTLTFEGMIPTTDWIVAFDNVIFGQVPKETPVVSFGPKTDYPYIPIQNNTVTSNAFTATGNGAHNGLYEFTASSNWAFTGSNIYFLADTDAITNYASSGDGSNFYYTMPYASNGTYRGATDVNGNLTYFWTTNVVDVGTISGEWVQYKLPHPIQLTRYGLLGRSGFNERFPLDYYILGSVDGNTWYSIKSVTNSQVPTWPNTQFVNVSNNTKLYSYYRLVCSKVGINGTLLNFAQFSLYGDNTKNYYGTPIGANLNSSFDISGAHTYFLDAALTNQVYSTTTLPIGDYTIYNRYISNDNVHYNTSITSAPLSVVMPPSSIVFPAKTINVVYNDTLAEFIAGTSVSPSVAGTLTFYKTNSSGAVLTASSVFDTVGNFTIFVSFAPTDYVNNFPCSGSYTVSVEDKDAYNNYYNIPVTDLSNILVNGKFEVNPFANGTKNRISTQTYIPGWKFSNGISELMNNDNYGGAVASFPPPFGNTYLRLINGNMFQMFYAIAGTYTFTTSYLNIFSYPTGYVNFYIDGIQLLRFFTGTVVNDWTTLSHTFTIATTGMHMFWFFSTNNNFFFGNMKILPVSVLNNVSYMKFSKINSQIFNGTFETEVTIPNSRTSTPLANWTTENTGVWVLNNFTSFTTVPRPYPSGNQCVSIEGLGKISQTFNYIDSSFNYLSFYLSIISDASLNPIIVKMNNTQITMASTQTSLFGVWSKYIYTNITTVAGPNTLSIEGTDATNLGKITMIDNVIFGSMNMSPTATTYAPPAIIKYGSPLAPLLNATCNVPATFRYYLDAAYTNQIYADSTLPVGTYTIYVVATPLDIYTYLNSFASAIVTIVDPNPAIVFPKVINVVYNDTLSAFINYTTVVPNTAGTFVFTNSSGDILTTSSVYNAVGKFTIFCTFTPDNTTVYETTSASYSVTVEDNDAPNNYFNIPVTDTTNLLVNGNFEYVPATYPPGTRTSNQPLLTATNIPGWRFFTRHTSNYTSFVNDASVSPLVTYPFPNGPKCAHLRGGQIYQPVFLNAGTYTFSCYVARGTLQLINSYFQVYVNSSNTRKQVSVWSSDLQSTTNWRYYSTTFTVSTTTTYSFEIHGAGSPSWFFQKMSLVPTIPNPQYLKFSKIDSQIFNGSFESEIKTANSISNVALSNWSKQNTVWVLNNYSSYISIPLPYPSGNQCVAIEKTGKVTQDFTYSASNLNYLSFYVCGDASSNPLTVKLNDISVCTINYFSTAGGTWQKCIYPYLTTVTGTNTLSFEGTTQTNGFIGIDNVIFGQVNRATTSVSFPTPSPIMYGTDLSAVLVATGSVPGSFRYYTDASYSVQVFSASLLIPSMYSIYARFIPSDQVNFSEGLATVDLSVNKLVPLLNYPTLPAIDYGTLLESSLIATTNIPSKIEYYLDANRIFAVNNLSVLAPGNYTIYAHLNPTDNVTYSTLFTSSSLTVNPSIIRPTMYYPSSPPITYGTNLTNMLNASIVPNVPGAIRYYTDASYNNEVTTYTILQPGIWTVYAIFTPTDATECTLATGKTTIFISNVSVETRKLVLSTADILASTNADDYFGQTISNAAGTVENNRYTYTWNTNIRSIMGDDFYNRYNIFSIQLKEFVNGDLFTSTEPSAQNLSVHYEVFNECKLSGIQFSPAPLVNGVASDQATMCVLTRKFPASSPSYHNMRDSVGGAYTFSKTADTVPIKIDLPNLYDDQYFAPSVNAILFGHLTFVFEIRGVLN